MSSSLTTSPGTDTPRTRAVNGNGNLAPADSAAVVEKVCGLRDNVQVMATAMGVLRCILQGPGVPLPEPLLPEPVTRNLAAAGNAQVMQELGGLCEDIHVMATVLVTILQIFPDPGDHVVSLDAARHN